MKINESTKKEIYEVLESLKQYLDRLENIEILYSPYRGFLILHWDPMNEKYYGIDTVRDAEEMARYIYGEMLELITVESGTDHYLNDLSFSEEEMQEAGLLTREMLAVLPEKVSEKLRSEVDEATGTIPDPKPVGVALCL